MQQDSTDYAIAKDKAIGTLQIVVGYCVAIVFGLIGIIWGFASTLIGTFNVGMVVFFLAIAAFGVFLIILGTKRKRSMKHFEVYEARLVADSLDSNSQLEAAAIELIRENVEQIMQKEFFSADLEGDRLVFDENNPSDILIGITQSQTPPPANDVVVTCYGCGATKAIKKRTVGKCEYCGNALAEK